MLFKLSILLTLASIWTLPGCGIPLGVGVPNDTRPSGVIIASGALSGVNGKTASGNTTIYNSNGTYIVRLDGISVTAENGLQVIVRLASQGVVLRAGLRSNQGSQNYTIGSAVGTFAEVAIYSPGNNLNYAVANLVYTGNGT